VTVKPIAWWDAIEGLFAGAVTLTAPAQDMCAGFSGARSKETGAHLQTSHGRKAWPDFWD
jgi:hypothetical protein